MRISATFWLFSLILIGAGCGTNVASSEKNLLEAAKRPMDKKSGVNLATFGSGCFWCTEAVFERLKGVESVISGYSGGHVDNPTYEQVCTGKTGHAESIQITYDPAKYLCRIAGSFLKKPRSDNETAGKRHRTTVSR
jgi:peptide-methionine (S)-S-oxide reductase